MSPFDELAALYRSGRHVARVEVALGFGQRIIAAENHAPGAGLQHAGHGDPHHLIEMLAPSFNDDHRAIVEVPDPLASLFPLLDDADLQRFARQTDWLERIGQVIEINHPDAVELGYLIEVLIVRDELAAEVHGQQHQLHIDRLSGEFRKLFVEDL